MNVSSCPRVPTTEVVDSTLPQVPKAREPLFTIKLRSLARQAALGTLLPSMCLLADEAKSMEETMRTLFLAALIAGSAVLTTSAPAKAQVDADITIGTSSDRYDDDNWQRRRDRGYHRGWREDRRRSYTVRRTVRPSYGLAECRTVIRKIWRRGERVTIRRRICD
jgi:hypothetical protein